MNIAALLAGLLSGIIGGMGLGGGAVLLIYLTVFANVPQLTAQGINLIFFIPIGLLAVIVYSFKKQIRWKKALLIALGGIIGAFIGISAVKLIGSDITGKIFAFLLIFLGLKEVFSKSPLKKNKKNGKLKKE